MSQRPRRVGVARFAGYTCLALASLTMASCLLQAGYSTPCESTADCPVLFSCVDDGDGFRSCHPDRLPEVGKQDAGTEITPGVAALWCTNVKPVIQTHCTGACHSEDSTGSGNPTFRLDQYVNVGDKKGAAEMAARIRVRTFDLRTMPPISTITDEERALLAAWADADAPWCDDGSQPMEEAPPSNGGEDAGTTDAGVSDAGSVDAGPKDAGTTADAGTADAGTADAGTPVSFKDQVHPILLQRCSSGCHTNGNNEGGLNLGTVSSAYASLVGPSAGCNSSVKRVTPGNPQQSMMWRKLSDAPDKCGQRMPTSGALKNTQPAEFLVIERWITQGALNN